MNEHLQNGETGCSRSIDHRPARRIPAPTPKTSPLAIERNMGSLAQTVEDHAAIPCPIRPAGASISIGLAQGSRQMRDVGD